MFGVKFRRGIRQDRRARRLEEARGRLLEEIPKWCDKLGLRWRIIENRIDLVWIEITELETQRSFGVKIKLATQRPFTGWQPWWPWMRLKTDRGKILLGWLRPFGWKKLRQDEVGFTLSDPAYDQRLVHLRLYKKFGRAYAVTEIERIYRRELSWDIMMFEKGPEICIIVIAVVLFIAVAVICLS